jgi:O-acetyl-ADP-ribose deacetylase (regulator of RNase III)
MTKLIEKTGSLFDSTADAYAHGVNTEGLMGAGIAVEFKHRWPDMYAEYKTYCKMGHIRPGTVFTWEQTVLEDDKPGTVIYNIASQDKPGPNARLEWFESALKQTIKDAEMFEVKVIAMPRIGCGIGGLEWEDVRDIIEHYAERSPVDIEVWSL